MWQLSIAYMLLLWHLSGICDPISGRCNDSQDPCVTGAQLFLVPACEIVVSTKSMPTTTTQFALIGIIGQTIAYILERLLKPQS